MRVWLVPGHCSKHQRHWFGICIRRWPSQGKTIKCDWTSPVQCQDIFEDETQEPQKGTARKETQKGPNRGRWSVFFYYQGREPPIVLKSSPHFRGWPSARALYFMSCRQHLHILPIEWLFFCVCGAIRCTLMCLFFFLSFPLYRVFITQAKTEPNSPLQPTTTSGDPNLQNVSPNLVQQTQHGSNVISSSSIKHQSQVSALGIWGF